MWWVARERELGRGFARVRRNVALLGVTYISIAVLGFDISTGLMLCESVSETVTWG